MRFGRVLVAAAIAFALGVSAPAPAVGATAGERSMSLSASKFDFAAEPGQAGTGEVFVVNEGSEPISVRIYAANQEIADDGSVDYVVPPAGANPLTSPASWVTFTLPTDAKSVGNLPYVVIPPKGRTPVTFTVSVPEGAAPGDRQVVLFFEMFSADPAQGGTARVNARLGARIETRVEGEVVEKLSVRPFTVPAFVIGDRIPYSFTLRNDGNVDADVSVSLMTLDRSGNRQNPSEALTTTPVYAGASLQGDGELALSGLGIGPQQVLLVASYVGDSGLAKSVEEGRTVWAAPLWLVIAAGLALLMLVLGGVWSASRRSAERSMRRRASSTNDFPPEAFHDPNAGSD